MPARHKATAGGLIDIWSIEARAGDAHAAQIFAVRLFFADAVAGLPSRVVARIASDAIARPAERAAGAVDRPRVRQASFPFPKRWAPAFDRR